MYQTTLCRVSPGESRQVHWEFRWSIGSVSCPGRSELQEQGLLDDCQSVLGAFGYMLGLSYYLQQSANSYNM